MQTSLNLSSGPSPSPLASVPIVSEMSTQWPRSQMPLAVYSYTYLKADENIQIDSLVIWCRTSTSNPRHVPLYWKQEALVTLVLINHWVTAVIQFDRDICLTERIECFRELDSCYAFFEPHIGQFSWYFDTPNFPKIVNIDIEGITFR